MDFQLKLLSFTRQKCVEQQNYYGNKRGSLHQNVGFKHQQAVGLNITVEISV